MTTLKKCKACGAAVSAKAPTCPQCGEPQKRKPIGCGAGVVIVVVAFIVATMLMDDKSPTKPAEESRLPKISADCSKQAERETLIKNMINDGYFEKTERPGSSLRVWAMPAFIDGATFSQKESIMSLFSAYDVCAGGDGRVRIFDAMTGESIGSFSEYGLDMD